MKNDLCKEIMFSLETREKIQELRDKGMGSKSISKKLGFRRTAIQREIRKHGPIYDAKTAHNNCLKNYRENNANT